jgi:Cyclic nucleotide-binding domain
VLRKPFDLGISKYDEPPPDEIDGETGLDGLRQADRFRFANRLSAWVDVDDAGGIVAHGQDGHSFLGSTTLRFAGQSMTFAAVALPDLQSTTEVSRPDDAGAGRVAGVRFEQTGGGRTGVPAPRRVSRAPYVQVYAPMAWSTLALTLWADGRREIELPGASPFPRHWVYDDDGRLVKKTATIDYHEWSLSAYGSQTPWGANDSPAVVHEVESALERALSRRLMGQRPSIERHAANEVVIRQGDRSDDVYVLLDGVLSVDVDGEPLAELAPGVVIGERAALEGGVRTATLTATTAAVLARMPASALTDDERAELAQSHRREESS